MGNGISLEVYENRIKALEQRVSELEQKVFLGLDNGIINNRVFHPSHNIIVNPSNENYFTPDNKS